MIRCIILLCIAICSEAVGVESIVINTYIYASSADAIQPLHADVAYIATGKPKPLVVVMHGYSGSRVNVATDIQQLAGKGVFAIAPDMRGVGGSAGKNDSGGIEVHDILDAVLVAMKNYPGEIDAKNLNIIGYSGGGGNAIACAVRFPDLFQTVVSFFGISDYAAWHASLARPDCNVRMEAALGGAPTALPEIFAARNANDAAGNVRVAKMFFFWDELEKDCPPQMIEKFLAVYHAAGLNNAEVNVSRQGDVHRWLHGYRTMHKSLEEADAIFLPAMLAPKVESPVLPLKGTFVVNGYLVTRHFQIWIEDGQKGQVTISYDLSGLTPDVKVMSNPKGYSVRIEESVLAKLP